MIQTLGSTTNFTITYQDTDPKTNLPIANALRRAQKLMATCESDFTTLKGWFGINDGFGSGNRVTLQVEPESLGRNYGYKSDGTSFARMDPLNTWSNPEQADDGVQALFVAEIIEILMGYKNIKTKNTTWHANMSDGEGLSRVAAALLHPSGYYSALSGPFVNTWLTGTRGNWVFTNDPTDGSTDSYGCAILFIYYLHDQLNYSMGAICSKAGATLEETYQALTGQSNGFAPFRALLNKYLPAGKMKNLVSDNPFPIWEGRDRYVTLEFKEVQVSAPSSNVRRPASVSVRPFFTCPEKTYHYRPRKLFNKLRCVATVRGFAQPKFTWKVNGTTASDGGSTQPTVPVLVDDAKRPDAPAQTNQAVKLYWTEVPNPSTYDAVRGELDLSNPPGDHHGHELLNVEVTVTEAFGSTDSVITSNAGTLDTADIRYEQAFYDDRDKCASEFNKKIKHYVAVNKIPLVFTLPDPAPVILTAVQMVKGLMEEVQGVAAKDPELGSRLAKQLSAKLHVPEQMLMATLPRVTERQDGAGRSRLRKSHK